MSDAAQSSPIASKARECVQLFESLADLSRDWGSPVHGIDQEQVLEHHGQLRIWASNVGALQSRTTASSLDHRLRDAPKFSAEVVSLLEDLAETLEDVYAIVSGEREDRAGSLISSDSESSDDDSIVISTSDKDISYAHSPVAANKDSALEESLGKVSEVEELFRSIPEIVSMLFKLSVIIRNSSSRDRFSRAQNASSRPPADPRYDVDYVKQKFPHLQRPGMEWLATRLGKAITQRRQFLWYCRDHREKMARTTDNEPLPARARELGADDADRLLNVRGDRAVQANDDSKSQPSRQAKSTLAPTTASTVVPSRLESIVDILDTLEDAAGDMDSHSVTSYATSIGEDDDGLKLSVVELEKVAAPGTNFECPYCWTIQKFNSQREWKKHVMTDLKPYICTAEGCDMKLFADSRVWFTHELQNHLVNWQCCFCTRKVFDQEDDFKSHISRKHGMQLGDNQLTNLLQTCKRPMDKLLPSACQICDTWEGTLRAVNHTPDHEILVVTPQQLRRHVIGHMEQMALFAIAPGASEGDAGESDNMAQDGRSQSSSERPLSKAQSDDDASWATTIHTALRKLDADRLKTFLSSENAYVGEMPILSESVLSAAAANLKHGKEAMELVLDLEDADEFITEKVLETAATNDFSGLEVMELLLDRKPEWVPVTDRILEAASGNLQGGKDLIKLLVESRLKDWHVTGSTLLWAARRGFSTVVEACLEVGVDPEVQDDSGRTPLMLAVEQGHEAIVQSLLHAGAHIHTRDKEGMLPLMLAAARGDVALTQLLLANGANADFGAPLQVATLWGHGDCVDVLLAAGADVDVQEEKQGRTPLMSAAAHSRRALVQRFLKEGAKIEARDRQGGTALWHAVRADDAHIIEQLLEEGAEVDGHDNEGRTSLLYAATRGSEAAVKKLLELGANPEARDKGDRTPFMLAAERGYTDIAILLRRWTANLDESSTPSVPFASVTLGDLNIKALDPSFKQVGEDWEVVCNPQVPRTLDISPVQTLTHDSVSCCIAFSGDSKYVATGCNRLAQIFEVQTGQRYRVFEDPTTARNEYIRGVCFSPDGRLLVTVGDDKLVRVWDIESQIIQSKFSGHEDGIYSVDFAHDGRTIASCGADNTIRLWDIKENKNTLVVKADDTLINVRFSPNTPLTFAVCSVDKFWQLRDASTGAVMKQPEEPDYHTDLVYSVSFSEDGKYLLTSSADQTIKMWRIGTIVPDYNGIWRRPTCLRTLEGHTDFVLDANFTAYDRYILSGSKDRGAMFWEPSTGTPLALVVGHKNSVMQVATSPHGRYFATTSKDMKVRIWSYTGRSQVIPAWRLPNTDVKGTRRNSGLDRMGQE